MNRIEMLRAVSRTFALSFEQLPRQVGEALGIAYLLLRVSDYLEDNDYMPAARKVELLALWEGVLAGHEPVEALTAQLTEDDPSPDAQVTRQAGDVLKMLDGLTDEIRQTILAHVRDSTRGMARWQSRGPVIHHEADMDDYMHEVAGRVGYLVTDVFAWHSRSVGQVKDRLMPLAREFGLALQTVNVIRGLRKDFERGWIYVPEDFCAEVNLTPRELFDPKNQRAAMLVVERIARKAERHLQAGLTYIKSLPWWQHSLRLACLWPLLFAIRTLALSRRNINALVGEAKITRQEIRQIIRDSTLWGWSNAWLDSYCDKLSRVSESPLPAGE